MRFTMGLAGKTLLIVEDDARVRELTEFAARKSGVFDEIFVAPDGAHAIRRLWRGAGDGNTAPAPDVILTDLCMPQMDGLQLTRALKAHPGTQNVPVYMFSSSGRPDDRELAVAAGCERFFEKPLTLEGLVEIMRAIQADLSPTTADRT